MPPKAKTRKPKAQKQNVAKIAKAVVKKALAENLEDKYQIWHKVENNGAYESIVPTTASSDVPFFQLYGGTAQGIGQGVGVSQRVGLEIIPKSHLVQGYVFMNQTPGDANAYAAVTVVKLYFGLVRAISSINSMTGTAIPPNSLLRDFDGTTRNFGAYALNAEGPINFDLLKMNPYVYKHIKTVRIVLGKNEGVCDQAPPNAPLTGSYRMQQKFSVNLSKHMPKKLLFNKDNSIQPENYYPVMYAVAYNANSKDLQSNPMICVRSLFKYTDA